MFKINKEKEIKEVLYTPKESTINIEQFLCIIFNVIERYVKETKQMPKEIIIGRSNYQRIIKYNKSLVEEKNGKQYILCTEIRIIDDKQSGFQKVKNRFGNKEGRYSEYR